MAELVSIEHARNHPASLARAQRREAARIEADTLALERWLADLATWPARFRRVVGPELLDPKADLAAIAAARAGEQQRTSWTLAATPEEEIAARLENYRYHVWRVRTAGSKGWRTQRRRLLRHQADRLVEALWLYGFRKLTPEMRRRRDDGPSLAAEIHA